MTDISDSTSEIVWELQQRFEDSAIIKIKPGNLASLQSRLDEYDYIIMVKGYKRDKEPIIPKE